ncbi:MAG: PocR ligand-binding domain-containing protein [Nitrospirae bacterium]|nr:PocR ligand-binding domain-containing protein [Nitrospirota bacterium]
MELADILSLDKWLELEKDIFNRSGLASNVFNVEGIRITDYKVWVNRICPAIKADDRGQTFICAVAHMNVAGLARESKKPFAGECDAGLLKLVVPIFVNDEFSGAVGACGLLLDDGEVDSFMVNRTIGMDDDKIAELSGDIRRITSDDVEELGKYITERIDKIVGDYKPR